MDVAAQTVNMVRKHEMIRVLKGYQVEIIKAPSYPNQRNLLLLLLRSLKRETDACLSKSFNLSAHTDRRHRPRFCLDFALLPAVVMQLKLEIRQFDMETPVSAGGSARPTVVSRVASRSATTATRLDPSSFTSPRTDQPSSEVKRARRAGASDLVGSTERSLLRLRELGPRRGRKEVSAEVSYRPP
eukprot:767320-Hanusia_phi.AAC.7